MMASPCAHRTSALASGQALAARRSSRRNASVLAPAVRAQAPAHGEGEGAALQRRQPAQALPPLSKLPPVLSGCGRKDQTLRGVDADVAALTRAFALPSFDRPAAHAPGFDVKDEGDAISITADAPGLSTEDVQVTVTPDHVLHISGRSQLEREEGSREGVSWQVERNYASFRHAIPLPRGVDPERIQATLSDGVLRLRVPKAPAREPSAVMVLVHDGVLPEAAQEQTQEQHLEQPSAAPEQGPACSLPRGRARHRLFPWSSVT